MNLHALATELEARGEAYATAVVVRAVAPTSAKPGDRALVTENGTIHGWVGGSCAEPTVLRESAAALQDGQPRLVHITPEPPATDDRQGLVVVPMTCYSGGALEVFVEPHPAKPALLVCGNSPVAQALVDLGARLGFRTSVLDLTERPALTGADRVARKVEDTEGWIAQSHVVVATHGTFDEEALAWVLARHPAYVGVVTSRRRFSSIRADLAGRGVSAEALDAIRAPAGLNLGGTTPEEIALSVLAEITQSRRQGAASLPLSESTPASTEAAAAPAKKSCCSKNAS